VTQPDILKNQLLTTGSVIANEEVDLISETSGRITGIFFEEGKKVRKGQLLIKINDAELKAEMLKAQYRLKLAEDSEMRGRKQLDIEAISQEDYDVVQNALNTVKAELQLIQAQIAKTEIRAPFDGYIGLRYVSLGSYISQNTRIARVLDINPVKVDFNIPEKYAGLVNPGDKISFRLQGRDTEQQGVVYAVEPKIDPGTRTLQIRARSANPGGSILPGAFTEVKLVLDEIENALLVPTEALIPELDGHKLYLFNAGKAVPTKVEIGLRTENKVQITRGIAAGDSVITTGILQLRPQLVVTPANIEES
jgi:membrane fusion protein (multidrug efflux system)